MAVHHRLSAVAALRGVHLALRRSEYVPWVLLAVLICRWMWLRCIICRRLAVHHINIQHWLLELLHVLGVVHLLLGHYSIVNGFCGVVAWIMLDNLRFLNDILTEIRRRLIEATPWSPLSDLFNLLLVWRQTLQVNAIKTSTHAHHRILLSLFLFIFILLILFVQVQNLWIFFVFFKSLITLFWM